MRSHDIDEKPSPSQAVPWSVVKYEEEQFLNAYRESHKLKGRHMDSSACASDLVGLALSGGGIRSATFQLGILQALASHKFLARLDYVSGVSGGGWIASWFSAWVAREGGISSVIEQMRSSTAPWPNSRTSEPKQIWHLRSYSNPLTPKLGLLSDDPWTFVATYLRNLLINLLVVAAMLTSALLLPFVALTLLRIWSPWTFWLVPFVLFPAILCFVANLTLRRKRKVPPPLTGDSPFWYSKGGWSAVLMFGPIYLAGLLLSWQAITTNGVVLLASFSRAEVLRFYVEAGPVGKMCLIGASVAVLASFVFYQWPSTWLGAAHRVLPSWIRVALRVGIGVGLGLLSFLPLSIASLRLILRIGANQISIITFGPATLILDAFISLSLFVGFMGRNMTEPAREWLAWFAGRNLVAAIVGPLICIASFYIPWWLSLLPSAGWRYLLGVLLIALTVIGVSAALSGTVSRAGKLYTALAPVGFTAFLVSLVSWLLSFVYSVGGDKAMHYWERLSAFASSGASTVFLAMVSLSLIGAWRIGNNTFSMHHFYRSRLIRCYLQASSSLSVNDPIGPSRLWTEDIALASLAENFDGPLLLLNAAMNLSEGDELAWQERKASSFCFSPLFCGYSRRETKDPPIEVSAYSRTHSYPSGGPGIMLGHAMAISSAALSPNKGRRTNRLLAFLMTILNLRPGWWLPNTRGDLEKPSVIDRRRLYYLLKELLGSSDDRSAHIHISDGGHFENSGIYELVRRRCRLIIASDASEDENCTFKSVGNAVEKCRVDFGAEISIDVNDLRRSSSSEYSARGWTWGKIRYDTDPGSDGHLLLIKSTLTGKEPVDIVTYAANHIGFPHESTAKQWFTESQFEAYRKLGHHIGEKAIGELSNVLGPSLFGSALGHALKRRDSQMISAISSEAAAGA